MSELYYETRMEKETINEKLESHSRIIHISVLEHTCW